MASERPDLLGSILAFLCVMATLWMMPAHARHRTRAMGRHIEAPSELVTQTQAFAEPHFF